MERVAIVTGSNKGIGYEIVRTLAAASNNNFHFVVACRNEDRGRQAVQSFVSEFPKRSFGFAKVDLGDAKSIQEFAEQMKNEYSKIDLVVHNAAFAFKGTDPTPFKEQARPTLNINYFGTLSLHTALLPLVKKSDQGNVVFVASQAGKSAFSGCSKTLQER